MATTLHSIDTKHESAEKYPVQLLVSVRDISEAETAVAAQVDWLDVKDPNRGPLGRPDLETALAIEQLAARLSPGLRVSIALGESREATMLELLEYIQPFREATLFKLAFSNRNHGFSSEPRSVGDSQNWSTLFQELAGRLTLGRLIPVFYADREFACGPSWNELVELAAEVRASRILIDTFNKDGRSLVSHIDYETLTKMIHAAAQRDLSVAIAGSLRKQEMPTLMGVGAAVIGVRGAACKASNREDSIDPASLQELSSLFKSQPASRFDSQKAYFDSHQGRASDSLLNLRKP
jgi:uncharacterized protein (UPF0264 family)